MDHSLAEGQTYVFNGVAMPTENIKSKLGISQAQPLCHAPVTLFAIPKPFVGDADRIQRNAIGSWAQLNPAVDVLLFGDEDGIAEYAAEIGVAHIREIETNSLGTPLVSSAFHQAHLASTSPTIVYCNADVILDKSFVSAFEKMSSQQQFENWLAIGQRIDLKVDRQIDFNDSSQTAWLDSHCEQHGQKSTAVCKEYFGFSRGLLATIPPFAVGRGNWDNWVVANTKSRNIPVVDLSHHIKAVHQAHDYSHMQASRRACYVNGTEAIENQRLAGGRNLISGSVCTHRLIGDAVRKVSPFTVAVEILRDLPRFGKLMYQLATEK